MILPNYTTFRGFFALPAAVIENDGFELFSRPENLRAAGFDTLETPTIIEWPFRLSVNSDAADAAYGVDEYDWYLSQRTDTAALQYITVTAYNPIGPGNSFSGSVTLGLADTVALILPGLAGAELVEDASLGIILRDVSIYVKRRSDNAYQWCRLYAQT